jgi:hypothetical protein
MKTIVFVFWLVTTSCFLSANAQGTADLDNMIQNTPSVYNIELSVNNEGWGTVSSSNIGNNTVITANANEGYSFQAWVDENNNIVSTESRFIITLSSDTSLSAYFAMILISSFLIPSILFEMFIFSFNA